MTYLRTQIGAGLLSVATSFGAFAQSGAGDAIPVTADNFARAESDLYFISIVKDGGFGKFFHRREPTPIEHQTVFA